jgi:hypothetical protein
MVTAVRLVRAPRAPGRVATRVAIAVLPHLVPLVGLLWLGWSVFDMALAYWGALAATYLYSLVRLAPRSKLAAGFFAFHAGGFLLACLMLVVIGIGGYGDTVCHATAGGHTCTTDHVQMPWGRVLAVAGPAALGFILQEHARAKANSAIGNRLGTALLVGRYYARMVVLFCLVIGLMGVVSPTAAGWALFAVASILDLGTTLVVVFWPIRVQAKTEAIPVAAPTPDSR